MKINKLFTLVTAIIIFALPACEQHKVEVYSGPDLVHFTEQSGSIIVDEANPSTIIEIGTTKVSDNDRSYTIKFVADESTAVEGVDFEFVNNQITILAGEATGTFEVKGLFDGVSVDGTVAKMSITPADGDVADFNNTFSLELFKFCSYDQNAFIGSYTIYENSVVYGSYNYQVTTIAGSDSYSIIVNGLWTLETPVTVNFNSRESTCSIPEQEAFYHEVYGQVYIKSMEDGLFNSCTGRIDGLKYMIYVEAGYFDITVSNWVMDEMKSSSLTVDKKTNFNSLKIIPFKK